MRRPRHPFPRPTCAPAGSVGCLALLLLASAPPAVAVGPGTLDPGFDGDGRLVVGIDLGGSNHELVRDLALQSDGMVVAVGDISFGATDTDFVVVRFDASGVLDPAFDTDGVVTVPFDLVPGDNYDGALAVAIQPDGKIVVAGAVTAASGGQNYDIGVARLLPNGSLDPTFGTGGKTTVAFDYGGGFGDFAEAVLVDPDGKIVVAGTVQLSNDDADFAVIRLLGDGSLDPSFSGDGKELIGFDFAGDDATDLLRQADGRLVVTGSAFRSGGPGGRVMAAARLTPDGSLDPTFGSGGQVTVEFPGIATCNAAALDGSGRLLLAGSVFYLSGFADFAVARLTPSGLLDTSFDGDGRAVVDFGPMRSEQAYGLVVLPDDRIVAAGYSQYSVPPSGVNWDFAVAQLTVDGQLDAGFGGSGMAVIPFDLGQQGFDEADAIALRPDGRLMLGGWADTTGAGGHDMAFAQLFASTVFTDGFESGNLTAWSATVP